MPKSTSARGGRHRDRLRRVEEFQFDLEAGLAEIALVLRDEYRRRTMTAGSTPILAFSASSARAIPPADIASMAATARRANPVIRFLRNLSQPLRYGLAAADKGALLLQRLLQLFNGNVAWNRVA